MKNLKNDFPIFRNNPKLVYLDSASTSQKPQIVIDTVSNFYEKYNSNIHRGIYDLSQNATDQFESVRKSVASFIGANSPNEIIFTSGTTESINFVVTGYAEKKLKKGDIVLISEMEHHSNTVAWIRLMKKKGIEIVYIPINGEGELDYKKFNVDFSRVKFISLTHVSNVLGTINPIKEIIKYFKKNGASAKIHIDAAQSAPHLPININELECDFLTFSSHKMLGPSGVGVLWAKKELLEEMDPMIVGSHMIKKVTYDSAEWADSPDKFEAGTRNLEGVIGLGAAIDYIRSVGMNEIKKFEEELTSYALEKFSAQKNVKLFGPKKLEQRLGVFSFAVGNVHAHDTAEILNRYEIAVRSGHHCAQILMNCLGVAGNVRASIYIYNTKKDIDKLFEGIDEVKKIFKVS